MTIAEGIDLVDRLDARRWHPAGRKRGETARSRRAHMLVVKARRIARLLRCEWREDLYRELVSSWTDPSRLVPGVDEPPNAMTDVGNLMPAASFRQQMMHLDLMCYLPDDVLVKVDRAAVGVSLETRTPFLDHRVVEFAADLPLRMKLRSKQSKWILRQLLDRYVPRSFVKRRKMGFGVPLHDWLRGPLREWADSKFDPARIARHGVFDTAEVRHIWQEHIRGYSNNAATLWPILMFDSWADSLDVPGATPAPHAPSVAEQLRTGSDALHD